MQVVKFDDYLGKKEFDFDIFNRMCERGLDLEVDKEYYKQNGGTKGIYLVIYNKSIIGFYDIKEYKPYIFIATFCTDDKYKSQRVGTFLMGYLKSYFIRNDYKYLIVQAAHGSQMFYEKMGFTDDIDEGIVDDLKLLDKRLKSNYQYIKEEIDNMVNGVSSYIIINYTREIDDIPFISKRVKNVLKRFLIDK